ncbi:hypothetical protein N431DRAFT_69772 [Stipitochalara longipes BDJ]|nr:hypothetical protein N431DRAFT_69772 [Stipitochalara longipes BDJ]
MQTRAHKKGKSKFHPIYKSKPRFREQYAGLGHACAVSCSVLGSFSLYSLARILRSWNTFESQTDAYRSAIHNLLLRKSESNETNWAPLQRSAKIASIATYRTGGPAGSITIWQFWQDQMPFSSCFTTQSLCVFLYHLPPLANPS